MGPHAPIGSVYVRVLPWSLIMDPFRVEDPSMGSTMAISAAGTEGQTHGRTHPTALTPARLCATGGWLQVGVREPSGIVEKAKGET
jgi:hypothetical protein